MFEKSNPVLIATPRSGSTVVSKMLFNIAHHRFGSKAYLNQFLTISPHYKETFEKKDNLIQSTSYIRKKDAFNEEFEHRQAICSKRIKLMENDVKYTTKIFTQDFFPDTYSFFKNNFDFVFIERRDKLHQLLSFSTMMETNKHEFKQGESFGPNAYFSFDNAITFFSQRAHYLKIKKMSPNAPVIYYEDFMELGGNTQALQKILGLPEEEIPETIGIDTIPTPYQSNLENMLINKDEWLLHKHTITKFLESIG